MGERVSGCADAQGTLGWSWRCWGGVKRSGQRVSGVQFPVSSIQCLVSGVQFLVYIVQCLVSQFPVSSSQIPAPGFGAVFWPTPETLEAAGCWQKAGSACLFCFRQRILEEAGQCQCQCQHQHQHRGRSSPRSPRPRCLGSAQACYCVHTVYILCSIPSVHRCSCHDFSIVAAHEAARHHDRPCTALHCTALRRTRTAGRTPQPPNLVWPGLVLSLHRPLACCHEPAIAAPFAATVTICACACAYACACAFVSSSSSTPHCLHPPLR